ncbi:uncharacterized protein LOC131659444 [Vicia villosa]|uniref:uncharacterized protein LOC131659444 n=1 Tax=Vicia villosa TaxID=3911 RepID=UPI00273BD038|nr:uncharacterized protein LOC131659444 [Vicia villosa]
MDRKSCTIGEFSSFPIKRSCNVDILQFEDDTLLVGEGSWKQVRAINTVLRVFEIVSGLGINFHKSKLIGVNVSPSFLDAAAYFLACKKEDSVLSFLGIPVGGNLRKYSMWQPLLNKMKKRLSGWKNRFLNLSGRITLLKSILSSLTIFTMSFYLIPKRVVKDFTSLQSNFLWGGVEEKMKVYWVGWDVVTLPYLKGGLNIKSLADFYLALINKWRWKILQGHKALWYDILKARYGDLSILVLCGGKASNDSSSSWWRDILKVGHCGMPDPMVSHCGFKLVLIGGLMETKDAVVWLKDLDRGYLVSSCYGIYASFRVPLGPPNREERGHSFFNCVVIKKVWKEITLWVSFSLLEEDEFLPHFMGWYSFFRGKKIKEGKLGVFWLATSWAS